MTEKFESQLQKLDLKDGDILTLQGCDDVDTIRRLSDQLQQRELKDVLIVCLAPGSDISTLNEDDMCQQGWVRGTV